VNRVAIIATDIVARVPSGFPERKMAVAGMTAHADPGLLLRGHSASAKADGMFVGRGIIYVIFADSVAACACLAHSCGGCGVPFGSMLGVHYSRLIFMAGQAGLRIGLPASRPILKCEEKYCERQCKKKF